MDASTPYVHWQRLYYSIPYFYIYIPGLEEPPWVTGLEELCFQITKLPILQDILYLHPDLRPKKHDEEVVTSA